MITYKGHIITLEKSGWFSTFTSKGFIKADTLKGIKKLINTK